MITKSIGLIIFIVGFVFMLYAGFGFITKEKVVEIGGLEVTKNKEHTTSLSPLAGLGAMIIGGVLFISGNKKHFRAS